MPYKENKQKPFRKEPKLFFHLNPVWLGLAYHGMMGESNKLKAYNHIHQLRQHLVEEQLTGNRFELKKAG